MAELKETWSGDSSLWLVRRYRRALGWTVQCASRAAHAMTWRLAARLLDLGLEQVLDEVTGTFRDSWFELRENDCLLSDDLRSPYLSYPAYLAHCASMSEDHDFADLRIPDDHSCDDEVARLRTDLRIHRSVPELGDRTHLSSIIWTSGAIQPTAVAPGQSLPPSEEEQA